MSALTTIEADVRTSVSNAADWLKQAVENHLPQLAAAAAEADAAAADPLAVAAAAVPGKYRPMAAKLLTDLAALDGATQAAESVPAAMEVPVQATTPADVPPPVEVPAEPAPQLV